MKSYVLIPHIGDVAIKVEADTLEELFTAALKGMNRILKKDYEKELDKHPFPQEILLSSFDTTSLLIDFLSEVLTLSTINKAIFPSIEFLELGQTNLHAHLIGTKVDKFTTDIKAVTYHGAEILKNKKGNLETNIIFDI
ncbi:MAG: archease [Patescibacteria group bacterium]|nr:archease [Patescibacteria group bacterium]